MLCQNWSPSVEKNDESGVAGHSTASEAAGASGRAGLDLTTPAMEFHYDDWLRSEALNLPFYTYDTGLFQDAEGSWLDSL